MLDTYLPASLPRGSPLQQIRLLSMEHPIPSMNSDHRDGIPQPISTLVGHFSKRQQILLFLSKLFCGFATHSNRVIPPGPNWHDPFEQTGAKDLTAYLKNIWDGSPMISGPLWWVCLVSVIRDILVDAPYFTRSAPFVKREEAIPGRCELISSCSRMGSEFLSSMLITFSNSAHAIEISAQG